MLILSVYLGLILSDFTGSSGECREAKAGRQLFEGQSVKNFAQDTREFEIYSKHDGKLLLGV